MKKEKKKTPEQIVAEKVQKSVQELIIKKLNEDSKSVIVKHLFDDRFRANIWKEGRIDKSFFIVANETGIKSSDPKMA